MSCEILERQFLRTQGILRNVERIPTAEQAGRALAHWLPAGLKTIVQDQERYIYLTDVPFELETLIRRWLRWQLDSAPETDPWQRRAGAFA